MWASRLRTTYSIVLYILLFYSIFDIYYTSPLIHGLEYERPSVPSLASTVVLIVADGLRYDKLYTDTMESTPNLRDIITKRGVWGFSHTRVPTESRPGHVAILAGFYEDVASITKGWQANAVEFDSVFNRSYQAFAWGGPDVVPMFQPPHRTGDSRVSIESYPHEMLDFTAENITQVDDWVVDRFEAFMESNASILVNSNNLSISASDGFRKGTFIFLHLSAADQMGHTKKPGSEEYTHMIRNLDVNIGRVLGIFDKYPEVRRETTFIFTADHGMTDWGSHGAGSAHETITPLIVWGKHVLPPVSRAENISSLPFSMNRGRHDIRQADLCPLIACLLGIPIPINSVGELPLDLLDLDVSQKVGLIRENALHILKQLQVKLEEQKSSHYHFFFREFSKFTEADITKALETAAVQTTDRDYTAAIETYRGIIRLSLEGLNYYHKYDRFFMGLCIILSYAVWSLLLYLDTFGEASTEPGSENYFRKRRLDSYFVVLSACLVVLCVGALINVHHQSALRTLYQVLPLLLGLVLLLTPRYRASLEGLFFGGSKKDKQQNAADKRGDKQSIRWFTVILLAVLMEFALWGFVHRFLLSFGALVMALWPNLDASFIRLQSRTKLLTVWRAACCLLAIFPSLPIVGSFASPALVLCSSICVSAAAFAFPRYVRSASDCSMSGAKRSTNLLVFLALLSGILVFLIRGLVEQSVAIPILLHLVCWGMLIASPLVVLVDRNFVTCDRLVGLTLAFFIPFNLMNVFYEGFFFLALATVVFMWIWFESGSEFGEFFSLNLTGQVHDKTSKYVRSNAQITTTELHRPLFFVFFVIYAFFGTGNIASINSFDPVSVYCFMTVLNPAAMGALLIFKIICPIVLVAFAYAFIDHSRLRTAAGDRERTVLMMIANFMAVHFFLMLKDEGSWLDIGESISHYVIAMSMGLASVILAQLGAWMLVPPWISSGREEELKLS